MATETRPDDAALRAAFASVVGLSPTLTRRMVITLADMFGDGPMAMVARLERLGLARKGSFDWFRANGGIDRHHVEAARHDIESRLHGIPMQYARAMALLVRAQNSKTSTATVAFPVGFEEIDPVDLERNAILAVAETIGGSDREAWGLVLVLLLSVCGERFLEVCNGDL